MGTTDCTILLLGATGQVGHELRAPLATLGTVVAPGRDELDLTAPDTIRQTVRDVAPDVVVNAAAYTAVDDAEEEPERAAAVNARAPGVLAEATAEAGGWLVHYSTDYVFDGTKTVPYTEDDPPNPINVYGRTKWEGEQAVRAGSDKHLLLRTSWVYSDRRSNFLRSMLRLADEHDELTVVDDQIGTPTGAGWIAEATAALLRRVLRGEAPSEYAGCYHLAAGGQTSWYGFARAIFAQFGRDDVHVKPISSDEYPTTAARPAYTVLDSGRARRTFDLTVPTWTEQLAACRARMQDEW
jgi:dTDP-4-dehydrorhamnose reductase